MKFTHFEYIANKKNVYSQSKKQVYLFCIQVYTFLDI